MRSLHLVFGAVVCALLGLTDATVTVLNPKDKVNYGQSLYKSLCTVDGGESFRAWKLPDGSLLTTTDTSKRLHVESSGTQHFLVIRNVVVEDGGEYECLGTQNSAPMLIQIPFNIQPDQDQVIHVNQKAIIHLAAHGYPQPTVTWKKDGVDVQYSQRIKLLDDGSLQFTPVTEKDNGTYTYTVSQFQGTNIKTGSIKVKVFDEAKITQKPNPASRRLTEGYNTTFHIKATGFPKPDITWWDETNNKKLDSFFQKHYAFSPEGSWTIIGILPSDKGRYSCRATNDAGSDIAYVEITDVDVPAEIASSVVDVEITDVDVPAEIASSVVDVVKQVGEKAELTCSTEKGDPTPTVRWLQNNQPYIPQKFNNVKSVSVITFDNVRLIDEGEFVCEARNRALNDKGDQIVVKKAIRLNIVSKPVFNEKAAAKVVYSFVGNAVPVTVRCDFLGYPAPDVKLRAPNGTVLAGGKYSASIKLTTGSPSDFANFTCEASNNRGSDTTDVQLKRAVAPSVPRDVLYEMTCKKITLKWTVPASDGGMPLTSYVISSDLVTVNVAAGADNMEHELAAEFKPDTVYDIEIFARSRADRSKSVVKSVKTNKYCVPSKPVITGKVTKVETNELTLKWTAPDYDGGDSKITYKVEWIEASDVSGKPMVKDGITELEVELTDLNYDTEYVVKLFAVNQQGPSEPATMYFNVGKAGSGTNPGGSKPTGSSTGHAAVPGQDTDPEASTGGLSNGAIAGIVIAVILIVLIAIDLFCCFFNSCGLFFCCSKTICGGGGGKSNKYKDNNAAEMEKKRLPEDV